MITNPNPNNFYKKEEMISREEFIPKIKQRLLDKIKDLETKIKTEEPFPHADMSVDDLCKFDDLLEEALNNWYY